MPTPLFVPLSQQRIAIQGRIRSDLSRLVFGAPGLKMPFAQRVLHLQSVLAAAQVPWLIPVEQRLVIDPRALQTLLQATVNQGGECLVVGYLAGQGRLKGQTGALLVQMPSGQRFALGSGLSDAVRRDPPPVGTWVTYRYRDRAPSG